MSRVLRINYTGKITDTEEILEKAVQSVVFNRENSKVYEDNYLRYLDDQLGVYRKVLVDSMIEEIVDLLCKKLRE
jgi:hypothetical protein